MALEPPPRISPRDIQRVRMSELPLDGPPQRVRVRFSRPPGALDLEELVRDDLETMSVQETHWRRTLQRGQPHEKLQLILKYTGDKYADWIEIRSDPAPLAVFRRRVLPLLRGCARSGCHGGDEAVRLRLPLGSGPSEAQVYTTFVLLDRLRTRHGPLIDREQPEASLLLDYMLPASQTARPHPQTARPWTPPLKGPGDRNYEAIVEWIASLRTPHPDYKLTYPFPGWVQGAQAGSQAPSDPGALEPETAGPELPATRPSGP